MTLTERDHISLYLKIKEFNLVIHFNNFFLRECSVQDLLQEASFPHVFALTTGCLADRLEDAGLAVLLLASRARNTEIRLRGIEDSAKSSVIRWSFVIIILVIVIGLASESRRRSIH